MSYNPIGTVKQDLRIELNFETGKWKTQTQSVAKDLDKLNQRFKTTANSTEKATKKAKGFGNAMQFIVGLGIAGYMKNTALEIDRVANRMKFATDSVEDFNQSMALSADTANELGLALVPTQRGLATLQASAKGTSLAGKDIEELFKGISQASGALSLTADETNSVFLAFSQIISKGKVQAEELRSQIGERLPGAMKLAEKAMGVTGAELDAMLQSGTLMADDLLPKLAKEFQKTFSEQALKNTTSLTSQLNILENSIKIISASTFQWAENTFEVLEGYNKIAEAIEAKNIVEKSEQDLIENTKRLFKESAIERIKLLNEEKASAIERGLSLKELEKELSTTIAPLELDSNQNAQLRGYLRAVTGLVDKGFGADVFKKLNEEIKETQVSSSGLIADYEKLAEETAFYNKNIEETIRLSKQLKEVNKLEDEKKEQEDREKALEVYKQIAEEVGKKQKEESQQRVKELRTEQKAIKEKIRLLRQAQTVDDANQVNFLQAITAGSNKDIKLDIEARSRALGGTRGDVDVAQRNAEELEEQTRLLRNIDEKLDVERV